MWTRLPLYRSAYNVNFRNVAVSTEVAGDKLSVSREPAVGSPAWIEIPSFDPPKLKQFYAELFPAWKFKPETEEYSEEVVCMFEFTQPSGLSGGILKLPEGFPRSAEQPLGIGTTVYYFVPSIAEIEEKIYRLGGATLIGKIPEGKNGWFANFKDPEGNRFGCYEVNRENKT